MNEVFINGVKYARVLEDDIRSKCNNTREYIERLSNFRSKVTHWFCVESNNFSVTAGKVYKFIKDDFDGEYVIFDDNNEKSMAWLFVEGDLLIKYNVEMGNMNEVK